MQGLPAELPGTRPREFVSELPVCWLPPWGCNSTPRRPLEGRTVKEMVVASTQEAKKPGWNGVHEPHLL